MRVKIYQINSARDNANRKFMSLKDGEAVDSSIYDEVFNAEIDEMNLEEIYARFNTEGHPLHRGHSLSVSDIVVMNGKAHICQSFGFKEIPFDVSQTQKPDNLMRVVYVEPNRPAYEAEVVHTLEGEQRAVKGYIEPVYTPFEKNRSVFQRKCLSALPKSKSPSVKRRSELVKPFLIWWQPLSPSIITE